MQKHAKSSPDVNFYIKTYDFHLLIVNDMSELMIFCEQEDPLLKEVRSRIHEETGIPILDIKLPSVKGKFDTAKSLYLKKDVGYSDYYNQKQQPIRIYITPEEYKKYSERKHTLEVERQKEYIRDHYVYLTSSEKENFKKERNHYAWLPELMEYINEEERIYENKVKDPEGKNRFEIISPELRLKIFSFLSPLDYENTKQVSWLFNDVTYAYIPKLIKEPHRYRLWLAYSLFFPELRRQNIDFDAIGKIYVELSSLQNSISAIIDNICTLRDDICKFENASLNNIIYKLNHFLGLYNEPTSLYIATTLVALVG